MSKPSLRCVVEELSVYKSVCKKVEELKAMYAEKFPYDIITVKRAHLDVSAPVWTKS